MNQSATIYARFSPRPLKDGELERIAAQEDAMSIQVQLASCQTYCERLRLNVTSIIKDEFTSARQTPLFQRPGGSQLKTLHKGSHIVCLDVDRMFRDIVDGFQSLEHFKQRGITIHFATGFQADVSTVDGYMMMGQKLLWSAVEPMRTAERTSRGMKHRQSDGELMTHPDKVPFGKRYDDETGRIVDDEDELDAMRIAVSMRATGASLRETGEAVKDLVRGGTWSAHPASVSKLLARANELNIGA